MEMQCYLRLWKYYELNFSHIVSNHYDDVISFISLYFFLVSQYDRCKLLDKRNACSATPLHAWIIELLVFLRTVSVIKTSTLGLCGLHCRWNWATTLYSFSSITLHWHFKLQFRWNVFKSISWFTVKFTVCTFFTRLCSFSFVRCCCCFAVRWSQSF